MNIDDLRIIVTVLMFFGIISIFYWAFSRKRKKAFQEASMLPFADELPTEKKNTQEKHDE